MRALAPRLVLSAALVAACAPAPDNKPPPAPTVKRTYTFKALSGVSMGAVGSAFLAGSGDHAKDVDAIGSLGGPLDAAWFLARLEHMQMGGFCPLDKLEAVAKENPEKLNDPAALDCMKPEPTLGYELPQDFNHWRFTTNGGTFDRSEYLDLFWDLSLALGNPLFYNPDSAVFPVKELTEKNFNGNLCDHPIVLKKFYNKEYNPEGKYDVITFCDGEEPILYCSDAAKTPVDYCSVLAPEAQCAALGATVKEAGKGSTDNPDLYYAKKGVYDPCYKHTLPASFELAVDLNGNGRRDYHEPVIANAHERWQDVGADGCANDKEDGKGGCTASGVMVDANHDDFDPIANPLGTERNFKHDEGEPYEDFGLDGVADTKDFGEGNGQYDDGPVRKHWLDTDFRTKYLAKGSAMPANIDVYADGGVRDLFNFGFSGDVLTSAARGLLPKKSSRYTQFDQLPRSGGGTWDDGYDSLAADYEAMGRNVFIRYGKEQVSEAERRAGNGDHVGTPDQLLNRFGTYVKWMSHHWERTLGEPERIQAVSRRVEGTFFSEKLKAKWNFGIALPPGYDDPANANKRYPVVSLGHGYGMEAGGMSDLNVVIDSFMSHGDVLPMIFVYPSGRCCHVRDDGTADCRMEDDNGTDLDLVPGFHKECRTGTFYVNRQGFTAGDDRPYGEALFELLQYVDANYRTLAPVTVDVPAE